MACRLEKEIEQFLELPFSNKVTFTDIPIKDQSIINVSEIEMEYVKNRYGGNLAWYMCDKTVGNAPYVMDFDLVRLLLGKKQEEYLRRV